jgi:hypothetical protein
MLTCSSRPSDITPCPVGFAAMGELLPEALCIIGAMGSGGGVRMDPRRLGPARAGADGATAPRTQ